LGARLPIIVGGTGLYFSSLLTGLSNVPAIAADVREVWRARGRSEEPHLLHAELALRDPVMAARLRPSDRQRIVRALEVFDATGTSLSQFQEEETSGLLDPERCLRLVLQVEPELLRARINARFDLMVAAGALEEVRALAGRHLDPTLPIMKAHGTPWLMAHLAGEMSLKAAMERAQGDTRRYAKRQRTWFRNRMADWLWTPPQDAVERALAVLKEKANSSPM
jgi:tRNA dimethylallyltransferase